MEASNNSCGLHDHSPFLDYICRTSILVLESCYLFFISAPNWVAEIMNDMDQFNPFIFTSTICGRRGNHLRIVFD